MFFTILLDIAILLGERKTHALILFSSLFTQSKPKFDKPGIFLASNVVIYRSRKLYKKPARFPAGL